MSTPNAIDQDGTRLVYDERRRRWVEAPTRPVRCDRPLLDPEELRDARRTDDDQDQP